MSVLNGDSGDNSIVGSDLSDKIFGFDGNDTLSGGAGADTIDGGTGNDVIDGGGDGDKLIGEDGDDVFLVSAGNDKISGGTGNDTLDFSDVGRHITLNLAYDTIAFRAPHQRQISDTHFSGIENAIGTGFNDELSGNRYNNVLIGLAGKDEISGEAGDDTINGGMGDDTLSGGNGNDTVIISQGNDTLNGGNGIDVLNFSDATVSLKISLALGHVHFKDSDGRGVTSFQNFEEVIGSAQNDAVRGDSGDDLLFSMDGRDTVHGGAGNDTINGGGNADRLFGDAGNDVFVVSQGMDRIDGGSGADRLDFYYSTGAIDLSLSDGHVKFANVNGSGETWFKNIENLQGSTHNDRLTGDDANNVLNGGDGNDHLRGGKGDDVLNSDAGNEVMTGGSGNDIFAFDLAPDAATNVDKITDFTEGNDHLFFYHGAFSHLKPVDGQDTGVSYHAIHSGEFQAGHTASAHSDTVRLIYNERTGNLYYDSDGNGSVHHVEVAHLSAHLHLTAADIDVY